MTSRSKPKITICGSMSFIDQMKTLQNSLTSQGCDVTIPKEEIGFDFETLSLQEQIDLKETFNRNHFNSIASSDAVIIANFHKHKIDGYIGPNTFMEMTWAYGNEIPIFTVCPIPDQKNRLELLIMKSRIWGDSELQIL